MQKCSKLITFLPLLSMSYLSSKIGALTLATSFLNIAFAGGAQNWANASDILAIGLPLVATGKALTSGDTNDIKDLTFSLGTALIATQGLKSLIHENRPDGSGNDSFPSGHTAIAFAAARFYDKRYGSEVSPYLYAAAGLTALARVKADKHYNKDVLVGAALGYASAEYFTRPVSGGALSLIPARSGLSLFWQKPLN
jgi:membrane-associated phospholipid phosphatase